MSRLASDAVSAVADFADVVTLGRLTRVCRGWRETLLLHPRLAVIRLRRPPASPPNAPNVVVDLREPSNDPHAPYLLYMALDAVLRRGSTPTALVLRWNRGSLLPHHGMGAVLAVLAEHLQDPRCRVGDLRLHLADQDVLPADLLRLLIDCHRRTPGLYALSLACGNRGRPFAEWLGVLLAIPVHTLRLDLRITGWNVPQSLCCAFRTEAAGTLEQLELHLRGDDSGRQPFLLPSAVLRWLSAGVPRLRRLRLTLAGPVVVMWAGSPMPPPRTLESLALDVSYTGLDGESLLRLLAHFAGLATLYVNAEGNDLGPALWRRLGGTLRQTHPRLCECQLWLADNHCGPPPPGTGLPGVTRVHGAHIRSERPPLADDDAMVWSM